MNSFAFWKSWHIVYQKLFWIVSCFLLLSLAFLWYSNLLAPEPVFSQEHLQELEPVEIPVHQFQKGTTPLTIFSESYVIFERVVGSALHPNQTASTGFLILLTIAFVILITIVTTLTRFWFFVGMGLFIVLVASIRLDLLGLFGIDGRITLILALAAYGFAGYYFVFIRRTATLMTRVLTFSLITSVIGACVIFFSTTTLPVYFLSTQLIGAGVLFTFIFIFMVAHEIIASFIYVISRSQKPTRSLQHFLIITAIYLINLALIYADKKYIIQWRFFPFSLFLLVTISGILGIWGFRHREPQYESIIKANPYGVYFYLALAGIGFGTMGYFLATANDPVVQLFQDAILYSHLGYGLIFFAYVISNFFSLLGNNLQVYKVLYRPNAMPYFTFRLAGLIATFTFFAYSNWKVSVNQAYAGYYNAVGDMNLLSDTTLAETSFRRSVYYATRNYHAHYALAEIYSLRDDVGKQKEEYQRLADGRPLNLAYLNLSLLFENDHALPKAAGVLRAGLKDFPNDGLLQNALSLLSARMNKPDTALLLAKAARNSRISKSEAETNLVGLSAKYQVSFSADSLENILNSTSEGVRTNLLALASQQGIQMNLPVDSDTVLSVYSAATYINYLLNHLEKPDTATTYKILQLARRPSNIYFKDYLLAAIAHSYYANNQTAIAFKLMREEAFATQQGSYYTALGLWSLEQGAPENAIHYLDEAIRLHSSAAYLHAVALTEWGDFTNASTEWQNLSKAGTANEKTQAKKMLDILNVGNPQSLSDADKFEYSRHRFSLEQESEFVEFANSITEPNIKARAIFERCQKLEEADETVMAAQLLNSVRNIAFTDKHLQEEILHFTLRILARQKDWDQLEQQMNSGIQFEGAYRFDKIYFEALLSERAGRNEQALKQFTWLSTANPFFEDAIVEGCSFLDKNGQNKLTTYSQLVYAMDINPSSVKLLKAYVLQSAALGYIESAQSSMDALRLLIPSDSFKQFIRNNPDVFQVKGN